MTEGADRSQRHDPGDAPGGWLALYQADQRIVPPECGALCRKETHLPVEALHVNDPQGLGVLPVIGINERERTLRSALLDPFLPCATERALRIVEQGVTSPHRAIVGAGLFPGRQQQAPYLKPPGCRPSFRLPQNLAASPVVPCCRHVLQCQQ